MTDVYRLERGQIPLLISMPHVGTAIPEELHERYVPRAIACEDTDWHLERLYAPLARALGASLLVPHYSRYLIDLNRPPEDTPMYPGASNTELCPTRFFNGDPLYRPCQAPDVAEQQRRRALYWEPYHQALQGEMQRMKAVHGYALLFDAHSIRSEIPWLFEGRLHDLCLGSADGAACDPALAQRLAEVAGKSSYSSVLNGRFKGGYITRNYGRPAQAWHAMQLEMCQCLYMSEAPPYAYDAALAERLAPVLAALLDCMRNWRPQP